MAHRRRLFATTLLLGMLGIPGRVSDAGAQTDDAAGARGTARPVVRTVDLPNTPLQLMRCGAQMQASCLSASLAMPVGVRTVVLGASALPAALGRVGQQRRMVVSITDTTSARVTLTWRPPLIAQPLAEGTLSSESLPTALRDALATGDEPASVRAMIALLLVLVSGIVFLGVPRLWWLEARESEDDEARELLAARALLSTIELEEWRGRAPKESAPRLPDDSTSRASNPLRP